MPYAWFDMGPDENGIERIDEGGEDADMGQGGVCETFGDAKAALIRSLASTRDAYQAAINATRTLRKNEAG